MSDAHGSTPSLETRSRVAKGRLKQDSLKQDSLKKKSIAGWHNALVAGLALLGSGMGTAAHAQSTVKVNEFPRLQKEDPKRAASILQSLKANPKDAKRILVQNRIEWCGAMEELKTSRTVGTRSLAECAYGPPDDPAVRNALIPTASTPFKTIRVKINIFANDDGSSPVATLADADAQMAQLNKDYASARIRFVNNGVRFVASTRFRNMASYDEISVMKQTYASEPARNLNFYVFDAATFNPNLLGVGYFPWSSNPTGPLGGFFCDNGAFGAGEKTATHEIGHVLGLWHPHYGVSDIDEASRCSNPCAEFAGRSAGEGDVSGDFCSDTPPTPRNFNCGPPTDDPQTGANEALDPCNNTSWGTTDYTNFMGYADDTCMNHFTPQQMGRMHGWINQVLSAWLVGADAADPPTVVSPGSTDMITVTTNNVVVSFSKPMNTTTTQAAFRFSPALNGTYAWSNSNQTVTFTPSSLPSGTAYKVTILGTAAAASSATLTLDGNFNEASNGSPADDYAFTFRSQGAPRNDMFVNAQVITGNSDSVPGFNIGATLETNEPRHGSSNGGASVWYKWTAPNTGNVTFDTSDAKFDTSLGVYTGGSVGTLTKIISNEDETGSIYTSRVTFRAIANTPYYIAVDGYNPSSTPATAENGQIVLRWNNILSPANDFWANAQLISGATGATTGTTLGAYDETNEPYYSNTTSGVWYKWVAPASGGVYFDTEGSDFDTNLAIYKGTSLTTLTQEAYDYDSGTGSLSQAPFTSVANTTYYIAVSGGYGFPGARGAIKLNWRSIAAPANDNFAGPITISGTKGTVAGSNVGASKEANEPYGAGSPAASVWYKWVAPASGIMTIDTIGSGNNEAGTPFDTMLSVYTGSSLNALTSITTNDDAPGVVTSLAKWTAVKSTTYFISVDGSAYDWRELRGSFKLNWNLISAPANDLFANAQVITGQSGKLNGTNLGANKETDEPYGAGSPIASVWFKWTAPVSGMVTFDTAGSGNNQLGTPLDTLINVFTGSALSNLNSIVNNDDFNGSITGRVRWTAVKNVTYYISVDGSAWNNDEAMGNYALAWTMVPAPANDLFANRIALTGNAGRFNGSNIGANYEPNEPYGAGSPTASVWFSWTASVDGPVTFNTTGSGNNLTGAAFDTMMSVYTGSTLTNLSWETSNDDGPAGVTSQVTFDAVASTTYQISIDGSSWYYDETMGSYVLNWTQNGASSQAPVINSFSPAKGAPGTVVTVNGSRFVVGATTVKFNGQSAAAVTVSSTTQLTATVPAGATSGPITATTTGGTATSTTDFLVAPTIASFTPTQGIVGTAVTITGTNFGGATSVTFGNVAATEFTVSSLTQIVAKVPTGALTGKISVITPAGTAQSAGTFTVGPWISTFSPAAAPVGASVIVRGGNFANITGVKIGNATLAAGTYTVNSSTQITATVPTTATNGPITVINAIGTAISANNFSVLPAITSFTPTIAKTGAVVTLTGNNFLGVTGVKFNNVVATFTVQSATAIRTYVPVNAVTGKISVVTAAGTSLSTTNFIVDNTAPTTTIASPITNGATIVNFPASITGTISDNSGISNVNKLQLSLSRVLNNVRQYWNPATSTWGTAVVNVDTTPARPNTSTAWSFNGPMPTGANLPDAPHTVTVIAADVPGNTRVSAVTVNVKAPTYSITGRILKTGTTAGVPGITVSRTGSTTKATTNNNGDFTFIGVPKGTVTLTPALTGYTFTPATLNVTVNNANVTGANFTATPPTFSVTGRIVLTGTTTALAGVKVMRSGSATTVNTNASGDFTFTGLPAATYTFTPSLVGYVFTPASKNVSVSTANVTGVNFTATSTAPKITSFTPTSGPTGTTVTITGSNLTGTTSVKFNGVAATFNTVTATSLKAVVPASATTGKISITTPNGTVTSTANFTKTAGIVAPTASGAAQGDDLSGASTGATSKVTVSSSEVEAGKSLITLKFSGPVQAADASHFAVSVNGAEVAIESVTFHVADEEVVIQLSKGAMQSDDDVIVAWKNLLDFEGNVITGHTFVGATP